MEPGQLMHLEWNGTSCWCQCDRTEEKISVPTPQSNPTRVTRLEVLGGVNFEQPSVESGWRTCRFKLIMGGQLALTISTALAPFSPRQAKCHRLQAYGYA